MAALAAELIAMGMECWRVLFPKGMDANEYALKVTPAAKSLGLLLNKAEWLGKGKAPENAAEAACPTAKKQSAAKEETVVVKEPVLPLAAEVRAEEIVITQGDRRYRVRGLGKNLSYDLLKINLLAS